MGERNIRVAMIIEVAGRPPEYLTNSMKLHIEKLTNVKGVSMISSRISNTKIIEGDKEVYSCFAEVELEVLSLGKVIELIFDFMPSSIEIIDPFNLEINCQEATMLMND